MPAHRLDRDGLLHIPAFLLLILWTGGRTEGCSGLAKPPPNQIGTVAATGPDGHCCPVWRGALWTPGRERLVWYAVVTAPSVFCLFLPEWMTARRYDGNV